MANPNPNNDDFYATALASLNRQMALASNATAIDMEIESYAKSLVEDDLPKIDSAVKSYLCLVAARSAVASDIDVISTSAPTSIVQCTFPSLAKTPMDANRCALMCARTLLATINSTNIPPESTAEGPSTDTTDDIDETKNDDQDEMKIELQKNATQILWNRLISSVSSSTGDEAKQRKPSKVLGRDSLLVSYPYIQERLRRGILLNDNGDTASSTADDQIKTASPNNNPLQSFSNELLPPVNPPKGIDIDQWEAFHTEFGNLLDRACSSNNEKEPPQSAASKVEHDDSALLWSSDRGSTELRQRRERRSQRATNALASVEGAKAVVKDAVLGSVAEDDGDSSVIFLGNFSDAELRQREEMRAQRATEALASVEGVKAVVAYAVLDSVAEDDGDNSSS